MGLPALVFVDPALMESFMLINSIFLRKIIKEVQVHRDRKKMPGGGGLANPGLAGSIPPLGRVLSNLGEKYGHPASATGEGFDELRTELHSFIVASL